MPVWMIASLVLASFASPASAQARFIGIDDDPQLGKTDAKVTIIEEALKQ